ncbi:unnamed protein product, partial [Owenia fusiformis]
LSGISDGCPEIDETFNEEAEDADVSNIDAEENAVANFAKICQGLVASSSMNKAPAERSKRPRKKVDYTEKSESDIGSVVSSFNISAHSRKKESLPEAKKMKRNGAKKNIFSDTDENNETRSEA